jgi:hypothetical protein
MFVDAIGEAPPSTVDVARVIGRERRAARWRRIGGTATALVVTVGLATGAVAYVQPRVPAQPSTTATGVGTEGASVPRPWPPEVVARLYRELEAAVPRRVPEARLTEPERFSLEPFDHRTQRQVDDPTVGERHILFAQVRRGDRIGPITFFVQWTRDPQRDDTYTFDPPLSCGERFTGNPRANPECRQFTGPQGERVTTLKRTWPHHSHHVAVEYEDGLYVALRLSNLHTMDPANYTALPLTLDEVTDIAMDPALVP